MALRGAPRLDEKLLPPGGVVSAPPMPNKSVGVVSSALPNKSVGVVSAPSIKDEKRLTRSVPDHSGFNGKSTGITTQPGTRSQYGLGAAKRMSVALQDYKNQTYIQHSVDTEYLMLNGSITDFLSETILSSGQGFDTREHIRLDPHSPYLDKVYNQFLNAYLPADRSFPPNKILTTLVAFVDERMGGKKTPETLAQAVDAVIANEKTHFRKVNELTDSDKLKGQPIINLDEFIHHYAGVCRHRALLNAYMIDRLMKDNYLPAGRVYVQRGDLNFHHTWAMYKPYRTPSIYLVDSMWYDQAYEIRQPGDFRFTNIITSPYVQRQPEIADNIQEKYFSIRPYLHLTAEDKLKLVRKIIDEKNPVERRVLLNQQYHVGCLDVLAEDIEKVKATSVNYAAVLDEIQIIKETETLHQAQYDDLASAKKDQFIVSLLMKYGKERRAILQKQKSLEKILAELITQKSYYSKFKNYTALLNDIKIEKLRRSYSKLVKTKDSDPHHEFILQLLNCEPKEFEIIFKAHSLSDLQSILLTLTEFNNKKEFTLHLNYEKLKEKIMDVLSGRAFHLLDNDADKQILITYLNGNIPYLRFQNFNNLVSLHRYLLENPDDKFNLLIGEIAKSIDKLAPEEKNDDMIARRALSLIRNTISSGKLVVHQTSCWACFYTHGTSITVEGKSILVPKISSKIYNLIPSDLELYNKNEAELTAIWMAVYSHARSGNAAKSGRDPVTCNFYQFLDGNNPTFILARGDLLAEEAPDSPCYRR